MLTNTKLCRRKNIRLGHWIFIRVLGLQSFLYTKEFAYWYLAEQAALKLGTLVRVNCMLHAKSRGNLFNSYLCHGLSLHSLS